MSNRLVSIIVPMYNAEKYIAFCIDSLLKQSYENIEIICIDDGSTDQTAEIVNSYKDSRIVLIKKSNGGVSSARNVGLEKAKGSYITFVDADDWVDRRYIEVLVTGIAGADISECGFCRIFSHDAVSDVEDEAVFSSFDFTDYLLADGQPNGYVWGKMFRCDVISGVFFPEDVKLAEDIIFLLRLNAQRTIRRTFGKFYYYYQHPSASYNRMDAISTAESLFRLLEEIPSDRNAPILRKAYLYSFSCWYTSKLNGEPELMKRAAGFMKQCRAQQSNMSRKKRLAFNTISHFPVLYRLYRILKDPTMLRVEKESFQSRLANRRK